jgi:replicative DNA helicase
MNRDPAKTPAFRHLPNHPNAEMSILGAILLRPEMLTLIPDVEVDDFYDPRNKVVFGAMRALEAAGTPIDVVTVEGEIERIGKAGAVGVVHLGEAAFIVPSAERVQEYAKLVVDARMKRDVAIRLSETLEKVHGDTSAEQLIDESHAALSGIRGGGQRAQLVTMGHLAETEMRQALADLERRERGEIAMAGVPTGIAIIDDKVGGNSIGILTLVIARPGSAKTTIAIHFCEAAKRIADDDSILCSWEDRGHSFGQRVLAQESGVPTQDIRARKIDKYNYTSLVQGGAHSRRRSEMFMDACGMQIEDCIREIRREQIARKLAGKKRLKQAVFDYLQNMPLPRGVRSEDEGYGYIGKTLATFAATDEMAVVLCCQLNREVEKREDHRPRESDIRSSGILEQVGKVIYGLYYPHKYDQNEDPNRLEILLLKNGQGEALLEIPVFWDLKTHTIHNSAPDYHRARIQRGGR